MEMVEPVDVVDVILVDVEVVGEGNYRDQKSAN